jgi:hypothetical protein
MEDKMIINVQFRCDHVVKKKREFEYEEEEDLTNPIGVICFNHAVLLANKGFRIWAEVGDQADECSLCLRPNLYPELLRTEKLDDVVNLIPSVNPSQEDILGYDLDDLGWWKCRTCGKIFHPSRFKDHMKDCVPAPSGQVTT